ncbi:hypothetical protein LCGC14_2341180, partial [marine sediment metagenome]
MINGIRNAKIESTMLGKEGHGIMTFMIYLGYDGGSATQALGGYQLHKGGYEVIGKIIDVVDVSSWEELRGEIIRVEIKDGKIY